MTLGLFNGTGKRHNDATLEGVRGLWVSRRSWWRYFTYELTSGQQTGRISGYSAILPKWVRIAGQSARASWEEQRQDAPLRVWDERVSLTSNFLNAERADLWERLASCADLMVLLCDGNGRFWLIGEDVGLRTTWSGKTESVQGYSVEITGQQRWAAREVAGEAAVAMIESNPTTVAPGDVTLVDEADLEYLNIDTGECVVLGPTPLTFCCTGGGGITEAEVQALIDAALAGLSASDIVFTPTGQLTSTNVQAALGELASIVDQSLLPVATNVASFDGANDQLTANFASATLPDELTFTCWAKLVGVGQNRVLFTTNASGAGADQIQVVAPWAGSSNGIGIRGSTAAGVNLGTYVNSAEQHIIGANGLGEWIHIAAYLKRTATTVAEIWVNAQLFVRPVTPVVPPLPTNYGATIGLGFGPGATAYYNGWMSHATLHSRRLTREELLAMARRGRPFAVPTSGLIAHWPMDSSLTDDVSGNGYTLTGFGGIATVPMN